MLKLKNSEFLMPRRRHNRDGAGCMSGIVSIFDFRHGHGRRGMLSDHITVGPSCTSSEVSSVTDSEEMHIQTEPRTQTTPRVKELMEEEMHIDHLQNHKTLSSTSFDSSIHPQKTSHYHDLEDLMNDFMLIHHKTKPNSIERSNSLTSDEPPVIHKHRNFFKRRSKSHECISLNVNESPIPSSRTNSERSRSQFSFTEIKRMLKNAIARSPRSSGCRGKPASSGWNSPNRDHFYSERFSDGFSTRENREFGDTSYRISNIYVEAKKHLSEMLSNGDQDTEMTVERHSRTLGKLLSFPEYNTLSASIGPRNKPKHGDLTTSPRGNSPELDESQPPVAEDDHQLKVSDDVQDAGLVKPASPEEIKVSGVSDLNEDDELSCSPIASPSGSSGDVNQKTKEVDDGTGKPSPVSILEPLFSDDDISPARTISRSAQASIQPRCIRFEEDQEMCIRNCVESAFEYVEAVLLASDLDWGEFEKRWIASIPILDSSLYDELQIFSSRARHDQRLLFDSTNQILKELCDRVQPNIHLLPKGMKLIKVVWERLESRLDGPYPGSLDQLIKKDLQVSRMWMDLCWETEEIVIQVEQSILDDAIDDAVFSLTGSRSV